MTRRGGFVVNGVGGWENPMFTWFEDAVLFAQRRAQRTGNRQRVNKRMGFWQVTPR